MSQQPQRPQQPQQEISIINLDQLVSMTSVEIAELTGKEHKHVLRDIRKRRLSTVWSRIQDPVT